MAVCLLYDDYSYTQGKGHLPPPIAYKQDRREEAGDFYYEKDSYTSGTGENEDN